MWNLDLQPLKICFHYHNAYGHQPYQGVEYREEFPPIKLHDLKSRGLVRSHDKLNMLYLHLQKDSSYQMVFHKFDVFIVIRLDAHYKIDVSHPKSFTLKLRKTTRKVSVTAK